MAAAVLRVAHGPLAVESLLLADVIERATAIARDPAALSRTLTIVVPSESLRLHLSAKLVEARGGALAGVRVTTLHGLAARVLERADRPAPRGAAWFAIVARRLARAEPALARELERFESGFDSVVASAADFFDAGFEPAHTEAMLELLADPSLARRVGAPALERARALVRVARAAARELAAVGAEHRSAALARATLAVAEHPELLANDDVWVRGFADATGRASDWIAELARRAGARVYADTSTIPAGASARANSFGQRFRDRFHLAASHEPASAFAPHLFKAPGPEAEVRAVAEKIRALLDRGVRPESIGVVARDLEPLRLSIRRSFTRLAVPFSALTARGSAGPVERRVEALFEVLQSPERASVERWLDARPIARSDGDLLLALRSLGIARLRALADFDLEHAPFRNGRLPLSVRRGSWSRDGDDEASTPPLARRSIPRAAIDRARADARAALAALDRWPAKGTFDAHAERFRRVRSDTLAWSADTPGSCELEERLDELAREMGTSGTLDRSEFLGLALDTWRERCAPALGGLGGGVQILSVVEARARTFDHLFVVSMNRGVFPRRVREDPLLPDALRSALGALLPDLPLKSLGHEEEHALFEELLRSSANVTLSWQSMDEDGGAREPSSFVETFIALGSTAGVESARAVYDPAPERALATRPAHEALVVAGLAGQRARYERLLPLALEEVGARAGFDRAHIPELAHATVAILRELDTPVHVRAGLTPYLGLVGPALDARDPRSRELFVTTLEGLADCSWRTFLRSLLQIEPPPDPLDALPSVDARILGEFVHRALHAIASPRGAELPSTLSEAAEQTPRPIAWPDTVALEKLLVPIAEDLLREEGLTLRGFAHVLVVEAGPYLAAARAIDASDPPAGVCGSEVSGVLQLARSGRSLCFRVDRVDRTKDGLRLVDFKTGKPISEHKRQSTRDEKLTGEIERGAKLQAAAYAFALGDGAEGRYAFLSPKTATEARVVSVFGADSTRRGAFETAVAALTDVLDAGAFVPRLLNDKLDKEHRHCDFCEVAEACVRGDSGARARLADWVRAPQAGAASEAAHRLWQLGGSKTDAAEGEES